MSGQKKKGDNLGIHTLGNNLNPRVHPNSLRMVDKKKKSSEIISKELKDVSIRSIKNNYNKISIFGDQFKKDITKIEKPKIVYNTDPIYNIPESSIHKIDFKNQNIMNKQLEINVNGFQDGIQSNSVNVKPSSGSTDQKNQTDKGNLNQQNQKNLLSVNFNQATTDNNAKVIFKIFYDLKISFQPFFSMIY